MSGLLTPGVISQAPPSSQPFGIKWANELECLFSFDDLIGNPDFVLLEAVGKQVDLTPKTWTMREFWDGTMEAHYAPEGGVDIREVYCQVGSGLMLYQYLASNSLRSKMNGTWVGIPQGTENLDHFKTTIPEDWSGDGGFIMQDKINVRGSNGFNNASLTLAGSSGLGGNGSISLNHSNIATAIVVPNTDAGISTSNLPSIPPEMLNGLGSPTPWRSVGYFRHGNEVEAYFNKLSQKAVKTCTSTPVNQAGGTLLIPRRGSTSPRNYLIGAFCKVGNIAGRTDEFFTDWKNSQGIKDFE